MEHEELLDAFTGYVARRNVAADQLTVFVRRGLDWDFVHVSYEKFSETAIIAKDEDGVAAAVGRARRDNPGWNIGVFLSSCGFVVLATCPYLSPGGSC